MQTIEANPHRHLLEQQLPTWARQAHPEHWLALHQALAPPQGADQSQADLFANALPDLREAVEASQARLLASQQALGRALKGLRQIAEFCEPLLQAALAEAGITSPVRHTELLRVTRTWSWAGMRFVYSSERHSLLQAALLNFADDAQFADHSAVALASDIHVQPITVTGHAPTGYDTPGAAFELPSEAYQVSPLALAPEQFARTCRTLDLGQQYQAHLQAVFEGSNRQQIRTLAMQVQRDRLRLAASLAKLRHTLDGAGDDALQALLDGAAIQCWQLSLFGLALHEVTLIDAGSAGLLLYLPGHAPALHACTDLAAVHATLATLLLPPEGRQGFLAYLELDLRARFLDLLQQNLGAHTQANLHLTRQPITEELFGHLQDQHLARIKRVALLLAVPTALTDEQARKRRLQEWESLGLDALMLAGFFVPVVGTLMLAVTACQLLDEAYEGYAAWSIGDRHAALGHLEAVGLNLALIGGLQVAGTVIPKVLGSPLMERLEQVTVADGSRRLWQPELSPYRSTQALPDTLAANPAGQWVHEGRYFIRMQGHLYEQHLDPTLGRWRINHPGDTDAYQPLLEHNGEGAWRAEHEAPQQWPLTTLMRRLGPTFDGFDDEQLLQAARQCGIGEDSLRQVHLQGRPVPPLLADSLARLRAERQILAQLEQEPGQAHDVLFQQHYDPDTAPDPISERLCQAHPTLPRPLARRLVARLSAGEAQALASADSLPTWLEQAARQVTNDLPLTRAIEGLWLARLVNTGSERLLWASLARLPGWPAEVRLELRAASPQGPLLQAIGDAAASEQCRVIKTGDGYEAHLGERPAPAQQDHDLCRAVLDALPSARRQQLGVHGKDADGLRLRLQDLLGSQRHVFNRLLRQTPPVRWNGGGLRGGNYTGVYPQLSLGSSLRGRYQRLFPSANDDEFNATLARWQRETRSAEIELTRLEERLHTLRTDLAAWAREAPHRQQAVSRIVSAWRRDSYNQLNDQVHIHALNLEGLELDNQDIASLALPDDFQHIEELELSGNRQLSALHAEFIERFAHLRRLHLRNCRFAQLPDLPAPQRLGSLDLQNNRITWDGAAQARLERSVNLRYLDLSENPLLNPPNLGGLPHLQYVQLDNASLTRLPEGLTVLEDLEVLDLSDNQLITLPADLALPEHVAQAIQLESDWLSPQVSAQIDAYYQQHGIDLLVSDHDYSELLDRAGEQQLQVWGRLPLHYRRGLRAVLVDERYMADPETMLGEFWRRLQRIDSEALMRDYALSQPAWRILELPL